MSISAAARALVRQRAKFACEYCGVTETDAGGELTVDHIHPKSKGGSDSLDNLVYCCARCNLYKGDYWPQHPADPQLWNPRHESSSQHFFVDADGLLVPLTESGAFTIHHLCLNRPPLVAHRRRAIQAAGSINTVTQHRDLARTVTQLLSDQSALVKAQEKLLSVMQGLLQRIFDEQRREKEENEP
jgi:hypothetical protein